jgi:hypothetical protein
MGMDILEVEYKITAHMCLFSAIICGIAIITSYIFPQQRKFPNVVLVWTWYVLPILKYFRFNIQYFILKVFCFSISDFISALYFAMELLPGPVREYFAERIPQKPSFCVFSVSVVYLFVSFFFLTS